MTIRIKSELPEWYKESAETSEQTSLEEAIEGLTEQLAYGDMPDVARKAALYTDPAALSNLTVRGDEGLYRIAQELSIRGRSTMRKSELVDAIQLEMMSNPQAPLGQLTSYASNMSGVDLARFAAALPQEAQNLLPSVAKRRLDLYRRAHQHYGMHVQKVDDILAREAPGAWQAASRMSDQDWSEYRNQLGLDVLGKELMRLGGQLYTGEQFDPHSPLSRQRQIAEYGAVRTGRVQIPTEAWNATDVQAMLLMAGKGGIADAEEVAWQRGEDLYGSPEALLNAPGIYVDPRTRNVVVGDTEKIVKRLNQTARQNLVRAAGLKTMPANVLGQMGQKPETVQRATVRLNLGPEMVSGGFYYNPETVGGFEKVSSTKLRMPKGAEILLKPGDVIPGDQPIVAYEGHRGKMMGSPENYQDLAVLMAERVEGEKFDTLLLQLHGRLSEGSVVGSKYLFGKGGVAPDPWVGKMGVDMFARINEPYMAAAAFAMVASPEQQKAVFGRTVERWDDPKLGPAFVNWLQENVQEDWLPEKTYNAEDPVVQAAIERGLLRKVRDVEGGATFVGQEKGFYVDLPMAVNFEMQSAYKTQVLSPEAIAQIEEINPQLAEKLRRQGRGMRQGAAQVLGAALANRSSDLPLAKAFRQNAIEVSDIDLNAVYQMAERAVIRGGASLDKTPELVDEKALEILGGMTKGRGLRFGETGVYAPNPGAALGFGFSTTEGEITQLPRALSRLLDIERMRQSGVTNRLPAEWLERKGIDPTKLKAEQIAGLAAEYRQEAIGRFQEEVLAATSSKDFVRKAFGGHARGARGGGRWNPQQSMSLNAFAASEGLLRHLVRGQIRKEGGGEVSEEDVSRVVSAISGGEVGMLMNVSRAPVLTETQLTMNLGYMTPEEAIKRGVAQSQEEYEQMFASAPGVNPMAAYFGAGDWDLDMIARMMLSEYTITEGGEVRERHGRARQSTVEDIRSYVESAVGGEYASITGKMDKLVDMGAVKAQLAEWANPKQIPLEDLMRQTVQRQEVRGLGMGGSYNLFERTIRPYLAGKHEALKAAREEALPVPYQLALDYKLMKVGEEPGIDVPQDPIRDPYLRTMSLARVNAASFGFLDKRTGKPGWFRNREEGLVQELTETVLNYRGESGELLSREARAALLVNPEADPAGYEKALDVMGEYEAALGEEGTFGDVKRRQISNQLADVILPYTSTQLKEAGRLSEVVERSPLAGAVLRMSYARGMKRAIGDIRTTEGGGAEFEAQMASGAVQTVAYSPDQVKAAMEAQLLEGWIASQGRIQRREQETIRETGERTGDVPQQLVENVSRYGASSLAPTSIRRTIAEQLSAVENPPEPGNVPWRSSSWAHLAGVTPRPTPVQMEPTYSGAEALDVMRQGLTSAKEEAPSLAQQAFQRFFGGDVGRLQREHARIAASKGAGAGLPSDRLTRQAANWIARQGGGEAEFRAWGDIVAQAGIGFGPGDEGIYFHSYGMGGGGGAPPASGGSGGPPRSGGGIFAPPSPGDEGDDPTSRGAQLQGVAGIWDPLLRYAAENREGFVGKSAIEARIDLQTGERKLRGIGHFQLTPEKAEQAGEFLKSLPGMNLPTGVAGSRMMAGLIDIASGYSYSLAPFAEKAVRDKEITAREYGNLKQILGGRVTRDIIESGALSLRTGSAEPRQLTERMKAIVNALDKWEPHLKKLGETSGKLNTEQLKAARLLTGYRDQLEKARDIAQASDMTNTLPEIEKALDKFKRVNLDEVLAGAQVQGELGALGGTSKVGQLFGGLRRMMFGWAPMQARRAWSMFGGSVFQQMVPAAAQAEATSWQLAQAIGGYEPGMLGGSIAGGMMEYQAAQRQALIEGGRAGYRAWGAGVPWMNNLREAQGVFGPAIGAGIGTGVLLNAAGVTSAGPIGVGVGAVLAGIGAENYLRSYSEATSENQFALAGGGLAERLRATLGYAIQESDLKGGWNALRAVPGLGFAARAIQGLTALPEAWGWSGEQQTEGRYIQGTALTDLTGQQRMGALSYVAQRLRGQEGTPWSRMDEGQILQTLAGFTPYVSGGLDQMTPEQMATSLPDWIQRAVSAGVEPTQYQQLAQSLGMGTGGVEQIVQAMVGPGVGAQQRLRMATALGQYSPLAQIGFSGQEILENVASGQWGELTGTRALNFQRLVGGDRGAISQIARAFNLPALATTDVTGMGMGIITPFSQATNAMYQRGIAARMEEAWATGDFMGGWGAGSIWDIQDRMRAEQTRYAQAQAGMRIASLQAKREHYIGGGTALAPAAGSLWGMQDTKTALSYVLQMGGVSPITGREYQGAFNYQAAQMGASYTQALENWGLSKEIFELNKDIQGIRSQWSMEDIFTRQSHAMTQREWTQQDWAYQSQQAAMKYGWGLEDIDEEIRYATGRRRKKLLRQRERMTTSYGMDLEQMDVREERQEQMWQWEDERFATQRDRLSQQIAWNEELADLERERLDKQREHMEANFGLQMAHLEEQKAAYEENYQLQQEMTDKRREFSIEELERSIEQAGASAAHAEAIRKLNEELENAQRQQQAMSAGYNRAFRQLFEEFGDRAVEALNRMLEVLGEDPLTFDPSTLLSEGGYVGDAIGGRLE